MKIPCGISVASLCLAVITVHAFAADTTAAPKSDDIVAALPVIPEAKFNLADFGGVGDGKTFNTEAFKSAIAAIAKAGGGHLIVVAGTYKTLPFTLTSHLDLHLEPGATIKAPTTFADYGLPDPNVPLPEPAPGAAPAGGRGRGFGGPRVAPLISGSNVTDVAITGSGTRAGLSHMIVRRCTFAGTDNGLRIKSYRGNGGEVHDIWYFDITMKNVRRPFDINMLYHGNDPTPWGDVGPREAQPGETRDIPNFHDIHVSNLTVTRSPVAGRILGLPEQMARDITFTNVKINSVRGFLVQDGKNVVFDHVQITPKTGEAIVLDNGSVTWNGEAKSGNIGGSPIPFYNGN